MSKDSNLMNWQQEFIATNLLAIGYNAWAGYLGGERGAIICSTNSPKVGIAGESFKTYFIQRSRLAAFLNAWLAVPDTVILRHHFMNAHILEAVDSYNPRTELVFLLHRAINRNDGKLDCFCLGSQEMPCYKRLYWFVFSAARLKMRQGNQV